MDNPTRPEDGNTNTGCNVLAATNDIQTALDDVQYLMELESHRNASIFTFDGSADAREAIPSTRNWCDNISRTVHSQRPHFSTSAEFSRGFNKLGTSRNHSDPYASAMVSSDSTRYWNNTASNYMFMNETCPGHTKSIPEIWGKCGEVLSTGSRQDTKYDETLDSNVTSPMAIHNRDEAVIDGQLIEPLCDLSQISRNDNEPCHISDMVASNRFSYSDGNFAASCSSGSHRDENTPTVVGEVFRSSIKGDIKSLKCEEIKAFICRICEDERAHYETKRNVLTCVDSLYYNYEGTNLLIHRSTHVPKTTCSICGKEHAVENSHQSEHRCPDPCCRKTFPCRSRFYQHILEHREYFRKHCWVCRRKFSEHNTEKDSIYVCCVCGVQRN